MGQYQNSNAMGRKQVTIEALEERARRWRMLRMVAKAHQSELITRKPY
jgi:hypothetical protein